MRLSVSNRDDTDHSSRLFGTDSAATRMDSPGPLPHSSPTLNRSCMPTILVRRRSGRTESLDAAAGQSLKDALKAGGVDEILALCGGFASCGTCHVHVAESWLDRLPAMRSDEEEVLGFSDWRQANSRLACQIPFNDALDGISVTVAPED